MSAHATKTQEDADEAALKRLRQKLEKRLTGFTKDFPADLGYWGMVSSRPESNMFPVPELVLLMLRNIMGFKWSGTGEKIRWSVYARVAGSPVVFQMKKFGFTILHCKDSQIDLNRVQGQLRSAIVVLEAALSKEMGYFKSKGHVTMGNHAGEFQARYRFFRNLASRAYSFAEKSPKKPNLKKLFDGLNRQVQWRRKGFFYSTAMVDSYFSSLEHRLNLLRAFVGKPLADGELLQFIGLKWDEKLKKLVGIPLPGSAETLLGQLRKIKERVRNPFAHGGVENDGGSLFVHLPGVGAIPSNLSAFKESVRFNFIPVESKDHDEMCVTFDEVDEFLQTGSLEFPHRLLDACIDPAFDSETLAEYAKVVAGDESDLENYIRIWSHQWEEHANMDYS